MRMMMSILRKGQWSIWCALLLAGLVLAGCKGAGGGGTDGVAGAPVPGLIGDQGAKVLDIINPSDELVIAISDMPGPPIAPIEERVREDGTITLLQNQTFEAKGKTFGELGKEIRERYVPKIFLTMTVTVKPKETTRWYYVGGEVKNPSRQLYNSRMTVLKAIQSAAWFTDFANKKKVQLTRANGSTYIINCVKALKEPRLDLEVFPGDTITVPRRWM
jgi:polysaccharide biosynthesis/export protein VpsN